MELATINSTNGDILETRYEHGKCKNQFWNISFLSTGVKFWFQIYHSLLRNTLFCNYAHLM
jgi:hypothetical protein